jgi:hypothetical protein
MHFLRVWFAAILLSITPVWMHAATGIAWEVHGHWRLNQTQNFLLRGDPVSQGVLLTADTSTSASLVILMPDGQRLIFDCYNSHTCAQGFRVPALMKKPDSDAIELFEAVRRAMQQSAKIATPQLAANTVETELVVPIQQDVRSS